MAETAVAFLMENVSQLLEYHASLISGAENELRLLKNDLDSLKALLVKKPKEKELETQIKEVVYLVEDTIDACLIEAAASKTKKFFSRCFGRRYTMLAKEVKILRESKLKPLMEGVSDHISTSVASDEPTTSVEEPRNVMKKDHAIIRKNIVALEDEEETIIGYLRQEKKKLDVISIIGMRGLGKTTLAWKIYLNPKIFYEFPTRIWIHASQKFNKRDAFLNIMKRFTSQDMSSLSDQDLIENVCACLKKEKFLLVVDDVRSLDDWKAILDILPNRNGKSKVVITSCDNEVGKHDNMKPHELRFLTTEESWELLRLEVFGNLEGCPPELEGIGRVIAGKCGGLPLQIVAVGGILVDQFMKSSDLGAIEKEWKKVYENVNLFLHNTKSITNAVELIYSSLPDDLRDCFLYMGVFPEDYEISAWTLTRLWIAEGFIQPEEGKCLEEAATQNLDGLISRNLVIVDKTNFIGEVKTCRVHDMIRGFCIDKVRMHNLFREIKMSEEGVLEPPVSELQKFRRLCVHSNVNTLLSQVPKSPRVRSFLCFNHESLNGMDPSYLPTILDAFNLLRVLNSNSIRLNQMPRVITKLFHLRYITLSVDDLNILPEALSKLWNLQTLVVETKSRCITVKANIWRLIQLRHLKTNATIVLSSKGKGVAGENLQTLNTLSPESCTAEVSERARNLKKLGIRGNLATLFQNRRFLKKFVRLEKLKLVNDSNLSTLAKIDTLEHSSFPPKLKWLTLSNTFLGWKHMSTLAKINTLEVLKLKDNAFTGIYWNIAEEDGFQSLHFLLIANADLVLWHASVDSLPNLRCLVLRNCRNLKEIPVALKNLDRLDMHHVPKSAVISARKIELEKAEFKLSIGPGC